MAKKKTKLKADRPKPVKVTEAQIAELCQKLGASNLEADTRDFIIGLIRGNKWLIEQIEKGQITLRQLRKLFGVTTERNPRYQTRKTAANRPAASEAPSTAGHGRNPSSAYQGAEVIEVPHETLEAGDACPVTDCTGKLYPSDPGVVINVTGSPIAQAKKYLVEKLRCALCGELFPAKGPAGMDPKQRYDESFVAMLMINKYFMAVPFYRQDTLQDMLGVPLPASTQWGLLKAYEPVLSAVYEALMQDAANGQGFYIDDTSATVLEYIKQRTEADKKTAKCFTTGLISVYDDHRSVIFVTNEKTAGKTFYPIWQKRDKRLDPPFMMADALTANMPTEIKDDLYTMCYCLVHARRNFYDLGEGYDDLADVVIDLISKIYDNDAETKTLSAEARLAYHQQHSTSVMDTLKAHLVNYETHFEPNSAPGKAIQYMLKRWTELTQFLCTARASIDNNTAERALKLVIRHRKNSLFYKTFESAKLAGMMQSLIYSAAQNDINPFDYMKAILVYKNQVEANPTHWLPWHYQASLQRAGKACQGADNLVA